MDHSYTITFSSWGVKFYQNIMNKRGLSCAKLSQQSTSFLGPIELFRWVRPTSISEFSGVRACVRACVRVSKLVEAKLTMTMKMKVVGLDENIPKRRFGYSLDPGRT